MSHNYARDWHQCHICGCTFRDVDLAKKATTDEVLRLKDFVYECVDPVRCARFKEQRDAELARDRESDALQLASGSIGSRKGER